MWAWKSITGVRGRVADMMRFKQRRGARRLRVRFDVQRSDARRDACRAARGCPDTCSCAPASVIGFDAGFLRDLFPARNFTADLYAQFSPGGTASVDGEGVEALQYVG